MAKTKATIKLQKKLNTKSCQELKRRQKYDMYLNKYNKKRASEIIEKQNSLDKYRSLGKQEK